MKEQIEKVRAALKVLTEDGCVCCDWIYGRHDDDCPAILARDALDDIERDLAETRAARAAAYEEAARLHENVDASCEHERLNGSPGSGAMGAIIEYRDMIRARAKEAPCPRS